MRQLIRIFICMIPLLFFNNYGYGQIENNIIDFTIQQTILPSGIQFEYSFKNGSLTVFEIKEKYKKEQFREKKKRKFRKKLTYSKIQLINSVVNRIEFNKLDTLYSSPVIDGVNWTFSFQIKGNKEKVVLYNYYLPELDKLLNCINNELPTEKQFISFDILGIKTKFIEIKK